MGNTNIFHEEPDHTENELRKMMIWLSGFFIALIIIIALVMINAQKIAVLLPFSAEKRFIAPYENYMVEKFGPSKYPDIELALQEMADTLSLAMDMPDDIEINIHFIDDPTSNAFATLGGHIFIFSGLIETLPNENSLAMIIGHELAHIKQISVLTLPLL